ncbi:MAG: 3'(2'),5'-bisphosphate nucleotidase CysQ [Methylocystis sp.]|nr:3'(2'),5'-bisphosphate nucleotidase CysQ [Methylocystis sp.]
MTSQGNQPAASHSALCLGGLVDFDSAAEVFAALAVKAGAIVMAVFAADQIASRLKSDNSPVSEADERAEAFLLERLTRLAPKLPVVAEEAAARGELPAQGDAYVLIDPLDGTKEFIAHGKEFTVNIALVVHKIARAGAIFAPALGRLWFAGGEAFAVAVQPGATLPPRANWRKLHTRRRPAEGLVALVSRSHLDDATRAFLARNDIRESRDAASSLKFCRLAEGEADVYPRFGPTMEWDIAAGDAILRAAGGIVLTPGSEPFVYGKAIARYRNGPFVAWGERPGATLC